MNGLQELIEKTEIAFPKPVDAEQIEDFFQYLARNAQIRTDYTDSSRKVVIPGVTRDDVVLNHKNSQDITGTFYADSPSFRSASFRLISQPSQATHFTGLRFETIPGYDLEEHNSDEVVVWDTVRENILNWHSAYSKTLPIVRYLKRFLETFK